MTTTNLSHNNTCAQHIQSDSCELYNHLGNSITNRYSVCVVCVCVCHCVCVCVCVCMCVCVCVVNAQAVQNIKEHPFRTEPICHSTGNICLCVSLALSNVFLLKINFYMHCFFCCWLCIYNIFIHRTSLEHWFSS